MIPIIRIVIITEDALWTPLQVRNASYFRLRDKSTASLIIAYRRRHIGGSGLVRQAAVGRKEICLQATRVSSISGQAGSEDKCHERLAVGCQLTPVPRAAKGAKEPARSTLERHGEQRFVESCGEVSVADTPHGECVLHCRTSIPRNDWRRKEIMLGVTKVRHRTCEREDAGRGQNCNDHHISRMQGIRPHSQLHRVCEHCADERVLFAISLEVIIIV